MCFLSSLSLTEWMQIFATVFSGGLLWVAWLAYKKLLVQEASKKQLEIVNTLVQDLVNTSIKVTTTGFPALIPDNTGSHFNIFTFSTFSSFEREKNYDVVLTKTFFNIELKNIISHLGNPLLPPKIADGINAFRKIPSSDYIQPTEINNAFYLLGDKPRLDAVMYYDIMDNLSPKITGGINGWIQVCQNLQSSIVDWYKSKGVKEINHLVLATKTQ